MIQFLFGFGLAVGAALVAVGVILKWRPAVGLSVGQSVEGYDELKARHDLLESELRFCRQQLAITKIELGGQVARATALQSALDALNGRDHAMGCENIELSALVDELQAENRVLRANVESISGSSSYVGMRKRDDRAALIRELNAKGWSRHRIELAVFGYAGGGAHREVKRVVAAVRGGALVHVPKS